MFIDIVFLNPSTLLFYREVKTTLTDNLLFIIKNIPEFFKSVVLMIGEIPYLLALAFSLGGLLFKTVN